MTTVRASVFGIALFTVLALPLSAADKKAEKEGERERERPRATGRDTRTWAQKMSAALDKKVTVEFTEEKLTDALDMVANITGLTIILNPKLRETNPTVTLKVRDMEAGVLLKWLTQLTETYAEVKDQAIYITDKPDEKEDDEDRLAIVMMGFRAGVTVDLPPPGTKLTSEDAMKIATQIFEKEQIKPTDFPGPNIGIYDPNSQAINPFAAPR